MLLFSRDSFKQAVRLETIARWTLHRDFSAILQTIHRTDGTILSRQNVSEKPTVNFVY